VIVLSISGAIYLFKPQIESWIDRPYDNLKFDGTAVGADQQVRAALSAIPGSSFISYEMPRDEHAAARVVVRREAEAIRVYVHPANLQILKVVAEDDRFMRILFKLHGELLLGNRGSTLVELAASWAIIMILTGLYLWWPRGSKGLAGVVYPRLGGRPRVFCVVPAPERTSLGEGLGRLSQDRPGAHRHVGHPPGLDKRYANE
jgi:uncharacterized iron-regulated membrane protein